MARAVTPILVRLRFMPIVALAAGLSWVAAKQPAEAAAADGADPKASTEKTTAMKMRLARALQRDERDTQPGGW